LQFPQTDAFARGEHRGGHGGDFAAQDFRRSDASKLHTVLRHPEENTSGAATGGLHKHGPEVVTLGGAHGIVHEGDVGAAHPESKTQLKTETCSGHNMKGC